MIEIIPNWHPLFVHFTVALFSLSVIFFIIQRPLAETEIGDNFLVFARYSLWLGVLFSVATLIAGWDAYNTVDHDTPSHTAMTDHRNWGLATFAIFLVAGIWWMVVNKVSEKASLAFLVCLLIGAALLVATGHKGSKLVYVHGLGVQSLPAKDDHQSGGGHDHSHDGGHSHGDDMGADHHGGDTLDDGHGHDHGETKEGHDSLDSSHSHGDNLDEGTAPAEDMKMDDQTMQPDVSSSVKEPEPAIVSVPDTKTKLKTTAEPKTESAPKVVAKPKPESAPKVTPKPEVESAPKVVATPKVESKPAVVTKPKPESAPRVVAKPKADSSPKVVTKPKVESAPQVAAKPAVESKPEPVKTVIAESEPKDVVKPEVKKESKVLNEPQEEIASATELVVEVKSDEDNTFLIPSDGNNTFIIPKIETYEDGTIRETLPEVVLDTE